MKASAVAAGGLAAGHLPWSRPEIKSFFGVRSAYAVPTFALQQSAQGQLGAGSPGDAEDTGQDRWDFLVYSPNTQVTITVTPDANLDVELFLYRCADVPAMGSAAGIDNLLQGPGNPLGFNQAGPGVAESVTVTLGVGPFFPECYTLAVEDERSPPNELVGQYTIQLTADKEIGCLEPSGDDAPESDAPAEGGSS
ncbi:MAG: hypothetical protein R3325_15165 [Thermoanaerobaculia bacterium]|nr:hypothetical protein [Thermoanaerobaculia bacterium]